MVPNMYLYQYVHKYTFDFAYHIQTVYMYIYIYLQYIDIQYMYYIHIQLNTVCMYSAYTVRYSMYVQWIIYVRIHTYIHTHITIYLHSWHISKQHPNNPVKIQRWYAARHDNMNSICQSGRKNLRRNWEVWSLAAQMSFNAPRAEMFAGFWHESCWHNF